MQPVREIVELTKELIRIPSTQSRREEIHRCAAFIQSWLDRNAISYQTLEIEGTPSLLVLPRPGKANVLLMAHFDVVEAVVPNQFEPEERDGKLYGRGAIDDKYAVALSLVLFKNHLERLRANDGGQTDMPFGLLLTGDEEIGGYNGAKPALNSIETEFAVALDGGNSNHLVVKEKGIIQMELVAPGVAAHGARPWLGKNAFDVLVKDYQIIQGIFADETPDHWHKTMVLSVCRVGDATVNKVPEKATAMMDIRYTENDDPRALVESIRAAVESEVIVRALEPFYVGGESPYRDLLIEHAGNPSVGFEHGCSDARFLSARGLPSVVWGADGELSQHSANEHLVIASLEPVYSGLDSFLHAVREVEG